MIPTPKWSPTLKWSPNRPRNDPHFCSRRPRNDPQLILGMELLLIITNLICCSAYVLKSRLTFPYKLKTLLSRTVFFLLPFSWDPARASTWVINPCSPTRIQKIRLKYLHVICNYVSLNITMTSLPITTYYYTSLPITIHQYTLLPINYRSFFFSDV